MGMTIDEIEFALNSIKIVLEHTEKGYYPEQFKTHEECLKEVTDIVRKYQQLEDFAKWVAEEVIDEDMWTLNHLAFAEIACRKLVQLGIMQESDGEYSYEKEDLND